MSISDLRAIEFMARFGDAFTRALAHTAAAATPDKLAQLRASFPEIFDEYANWPTPQEDPE